MRSINHADWYVNKVLAQAEDYRAAASTPATSPDGWVVPHWPVELAGLDQHIALVTGSLPGPIWRCVHGR
ncbi:hypothetical protein OOZ19_09985 [Saccharopolyspora sp. NFXS83]|uniref:hypothetical protein n=1 Tax=Saccharopolyspora sp. NFXS83 TaxID=2993560 RepID=UPI00224A6A01|nr:hypothetical protein [Saccharopolyspora sp. NFXS83]MCX2730570.1 hypothetical protein [Saccharopolyspora sp. NFXS83]